MNKKGDGVYRRFVHHIPTKGIMSVRRDRVQTVNSKFYHAKENAGKGVAIPGIKEIHRMAAPGYPDVFKVSKRPCPYCEHCMAGNFDACETHEDTKVMEARLDPPNTPDPNPCDSALANQGRIMGSNAKKGEFLAIETESDVVPWMLVRAEQDGAREISTEALEANPSLGGEITFEFREDSHDRLAIRAVPLRPVENSYGAGGYSTTMFIIDERDEPMEVPCYLLRKDNVTLKEVRGASEPNETAESRGGRTWKRKRKRKRDGSSLSIAPDAKDPRVIYMLDGNTKAEILRRARVWS
mgnify:CR=1 FL=1